MDAQTRHELKQNELADFLLRLRTLVGDKRTLYWVAGLAVVVLLVLGYRFWRDMRAESLQKAWQQFAAIDPQSENPAASPLDELRNLANTASDPALASAARLRLAGALLNKAHGDPAQRQQYLQETVDLTKQISGDTRTASALAAAAMYLMASAYESQQNFEQAKATYKTLMEDKRFVGSPFQILASQRVTDVGDLNARVVFVPGDAPPPPPPPSQPALPSAPLSQPASPALPAGETTPLPPPPASQPPAGSGGLGQP